MNALTSVPFNSPYELGIRMVYLLSSLFPKGASLHKLLLLDYAVIYSGDLGGPDSLHPPIPHRGAELYIRYDAVKTGVYLMSVKGLIYANFNANGLTYYAGNNSRTLVDSIESTYTEGLISRCEWASRKFGDVDTVNLAGYFSEVGHRWGAEIEGLVCEGEG